ncbi:hypothetical protein DPMN_117816 [Dreissena polymorpha]|uniref:Uncharacterized protein n=1 Tax=Dreissena polymorpha TaxID=45954 RepID=A0A9D4JPN4_DREPO|nr:hypothetical protein DPMN_117816 [Dreissena polymorpha]
MQTRILCVADEFCSFPSFWGVDIEKISWFHPVLGPGIAIVVELLGVPVLEKL